MMQKILVMVLVLACSPCWSVEVASMQQRSELIDRMLEDRFEQVLPALMRREQIDLWVIMSREYNEDPVLKTMLPSSWISARRHTMLVIYDPGAGKPLESLAVARYAVADLFAQAWDKESQPDQWAANRLQDIVTGHFKVGRSGSEILRRSREQAIKEGLKPSIYTHPLGLDGHAAGPTIGMWDAQEGVPVTGDYPMYPDTAYSIELNAATFIPEWGKEGRIMLEEDALFDGSEVEYFDGRQRSFHLISSAPAN